MSDELLQLGLDTESIRKELDRLSARFEKSMDRNAKATNRMGNAIATVTRGASRLAGLFGVGLGVAGLKQAANLALDLGKNIEAAADRFAAGSERLKAATGGADHEKAGMAIAVSADLEDFTERAKRKAGEVVAEVAIGWKAIIAATVAGAKGAMGGGLLNSFRSKEGIGGGAAAGVNAAMDAEAASLSKKAAKGEEAMKITERIRDIERSIAERQQTGLITIQEQNELLKEQAALADARNKLATHSLVADRKAENAAKEAQGQALAASVAFRESRAKELRDAQVSIDITKAEHAGMKNVAAQLKIRHEFDEKLIAAARAGNEELGKRLLIQKNLAMAAARVVSHDLTPTERRDERRQARKFARTEKKQVAQEAEMAKRAARMAAEGHKPTPGSKMDRFMAAQKDNAVPILERIAKAVEKPPQAPQNAR
jgi:hypothetical protein